MEEDEAPETEPASCCIAISAFIVASLSDAVGEPVRLLAGVAPVAGVSGTIAMVIVVAVVLDEDDEVAESCDSSDDNNWLAGLEAETEDVMAISKEVEVPEFFRRLGSSEDYAGVMRFPPRGVSQKTG